MHPIMPSFSRNLRFRFGIIARHFDPYQIYDGALKEEDKQATGIQLLLGSNLQPPPPPIIFPFNNCLFTYLQQ